MVGLAGAPARRTRQNRPAPPFSIAMAFGEQTSRWLSYPIGKGKPLDEVELTVQDFKQQIRTTKYYDAMTSFLMAAGHTLKELMEYLGHDDLQMVQRYTKLPPQPGAHDPAERLNAYLAKRRRRRGG